MLCEEVGGQVEEVLMLGPTREVGADEGRLGGQQSLQLLLEVERGEVDLPPLGHHAVAQVTEPLLGAGRGGGRLVHRD